MKAEIISIGTELTSGRNLDTNCQWLSRRLSELGIAVGWHTTVADDLDANLEVFRTAARRARLVLCTGGLGPTLDDLTREVLARLAGVELVLDPASLEHIEAMFARRSRTMPERNRVQAYFPAGAEPLSNPLGTAPGVWQVVDGCAIAAMPGVPSEMHAMFEQQVVPRLGQLGLTGGVMLERKINCFGAGESAVEQKLGDLTARGRDPEVGITASDATISLRIIAHAPTRDEALARILPVEQTIRETLGSLVFGVDDEDLQTAVLRLLDEKRLTLATAESVTGGLVAQRLTDVPGSSRWFLGGVVTYTNPVKTALLGVPESLLQEHGAVSAPVVEAMAVGCRTRLRSDIAVSTVGIAGPGGATAEKPVGLVHVGLAWEGGVSSVSFSWTGTRPEVRSRTAKLALNRVRLHLLGEKGAAAFR